MPPEFEIVRPLAGSGGGGSVGLVRRDGRLFVLKSHKLSSIAAERLFQQTLKARGLPSLALEHHADLRPDQILMEYVEGSPTIGGAPSPAMCERWGAAVAALHRERADALQILDDTGHQVDSNWPDFLESLIRRALQRNPGNDLPEHLLAQAEQKLAALHAFQPDTFVLTHGDLHVNNALVRGDDIVLFDKASVVWTAPAIFDICLIHSEAFPGAHYGANTNGGDPGRLAAFLRGYGEVPGDQEKWLDHFVLLRLLRRYPNPFVPTQRFVIETALERIS